MSPPRLALTFIGDEVGPSLPEMISFCRENDLRRIDMRTVDGRNLLGMKVAEVAVIADTLMDAGIEVTSFVSPVLKWEAPDKTAEGGKVDFAFDPASCPSDDPVAYAFDIALVLRTTRIRVFSYLRYSGYQPLDLKKQIDKFAGLSARDDMVVELENEPVCNIGSVAELATFFAAQTEKEPNRYNQNRPRLLRPLVDIGNSWFMGAPPTAEDIAALAPIVDLIHVKDGDLKAKRGVPVGDGDVPWAMELKRLLEGVTVDEVIVSLETHCPGDGRAATAKSVAALRRIAGEIGVEIV